MGFLEAVYWITIVFGALAILGILTNLSLAVFAAGSTMMQAYAYSFNDFHHGEAVMALGLVFLALSPSGRLLSVDRLVSRLRETIRNRAFVPLLSLEETSDAARWPVLAMLWILALIYASAAFYKLKFAGLEWMNGHTLRYYLLQDGLRWSRPAGLALAHHQTLAVLMSIGSLLFELTFCLTLVFPSIVWAYVTAGIVMHIGIFELMHANFWEFVAMYALILPWTVGFAFLRRRMEPRVAPRRMEMVYDGECFLCLRSMTVIDALDWLGFVRLSPFQDADVARRCERLGITPADTRRELHLLLPDGSIRRGFFAFRRMAWAVPALFPLAPFLYLPGAAWIGPRVYRFIADNRRRFETCENDACRI
jgi:predicted DCC family thiol-disulfide oxidoreductase YuxK